MKPFNFGNFGHNRGSGTKPLPRIGVFPLKKIIDPVTEAEKIVEDYVRALRGEAEETARRSSALPAALVIFGMLALIGSGMALLMHRGG